MADRAVLELGEMIEMRTTKRKSAVLVPAAIFAIAGSALTAQADIVVDGSTTLTFEDIDPGRRVDWTFGITHGNSRAGFFNWSGGVQTFCIQLREDINDGDTVNFDVVSIENLPDQPPLLPGPLGAERAVVMRDLFSRYYGEVASKTGGAANRWAAAFQIAVWEISHELWADDRDAEDFIDDLGVARGIAEFDASDNVMNLADSMLSNLGDGGFLNTVELVGLTNPHYQDQIMVVSSTMVVPGIGSLAVLGAIGALGGRRRR